jgi:hypothetical protein
MRHGAYSPKAVNAQGEATASKAVSSLYSLVKERNYDNYRHNGPVNDSDGYPVVSGTSKLGATETYENFDTTFHCGTAVWSWSRSRASTREASVGSQTNTP